MANDDVTAIGGAGQSLPGEIWKPVPSEPGVLASSLGRVLLPPRYAPMSNGGFRAYFPAPRYGQESKACAGAKHRFMIVMVRDETKPARQRPRKVHQLVCEAFNGPKPFPEAVVVHMDENGTNNRAENLKWGTQRENMNASGFIEYCKGRTGENSPRVKGKAKAA